MLISKIQTNLIQQNKINNTKPLLTSQVIISHTELPKGIDGKYFVNINFKGAEELCEAALYNNIYALVKELNNGNDINSQDKSGFTALNWACRLGYDNIANYLLKMYPNVDVNLPDEDGYTALINAAMFGHTGVVKLLMDCDKTDINAVTKDGMTALHWASFEGYDDVVKILLMHPNIDINKTDKHGCTPLILAAGNSRYKTAEMLINHPNIDMNKQNNIKNTALMNGHRDIEMVKILLKHPDVDISLTDMNDRTARGLARLYEDREVVDLIDNYQRGEDNRTPQISDEPVKSLTLQQMFPEYERMEIELASSDSMVKKYALDYLEKVIDSDKYNPSIKDNFGRNVIHLSMLSRDERIKTIINKALAKGIDINDGNMVGQTPLMMAIKNLITAKDDNERIVDLSVIKYILDKNPDMDIQDRNGQTAFHLACMSTSVALLTLMLSKKPNMQLKDIKGKIGADYFRTNAMKETYEKYLRG